MEPLFGTTTIATNSLSKADIALVIDVSNLAWRQSTANQWSKTSTRKFSGHIYGTMNSLLSILGSAIGGFAAPQRTAMFVFVTDGTPVRAKKAYPEYKAGRIKPSFSPVADVVELCKAIPGIWLHNAVEEADFVIASFVRQQSIPCQIITTDHDMWQLMNAQVDIVGLQQRTIRMDDLEAYFGGIGPQHIPLYKAIYGDKSDNIPSVTGLGRKKHAHIVPLIRQATNPSEFFDLADDDLDLPLEVYGSLYNQRKQIETMFDIVSLARDVSYDTIITGDLARLAKIMQEYECRSLVTRIGEAFKE